ncbi:MAG: SspB family protein [Betaproteobacteria bacterium]
MDPLYTRAMDGSDASAGFDYPALLRHALLDVVRGVLARAAEEGLPGDHHFYLTFGTGDDGVELAPRLRLQFPDEMTIVLQHQYWNLVVDEAGFAVTLRFGGAPERLVVPWAALRSFADPSVGFGVQLRPAGAAAGPDAPTQAGAPGAVQAGPVPSEPEADRPRAGEDGKVVDLGAFRRRSDG